MPNALSTLLKKRLFGKNRNLVSLDEPYQIMAGLLARSSVTGILDAGASDGHISRRFLRRFPNADVYAFEPNPLYRDRLEEYARNESRFHPQFVALSDHAGRSVLHITESPGATSLLNPSSALNRVAPEGGILKKEHEVEVTTIDEWASQQGDIRIELMKFDIQGGELDALRGAVRTLQESTSMVFTEVWFNPVYERSPVFGEIDAFLREHGFVLYDLFKPKYDMKGRLTWGDAIFLNPDRVSE